MKEEEGAKWMVEQFAKGIIYNDNNNVDHLVKARQMGELWKTITVRGVNTATPIKIIEQHFKQFGEVNEISFVEKGINKVIIKLKMEEEKKLPVFILNPKRGGNYMERWELSYAGCPRVCLKCFEQGHIKKDCESQGPTVSQINKGEVTWAQVVSHPPQLQQQLLTKQVQVLEGKQSPPVQQPTPKAPINTTLTLPSSSAQQSLIPPPLLSPSATSQIDEESLASEWVEGRKKKGAESKKRPAGSPTGSPGEQRMKRSCDIELSNLFQPLESPQEGGENEKEYDEKEEMENKESRSNNEENQVEGIVEMPTQYDQGKKIPQLDGHIEEDFNSDIAPNLFNYREMTMEEDNMFRRKNESESSIEEENVYDGELSEKGDCSICGKKGRRCQGCFMTHYCSSMCQKKDWKDHKPMCMDHQASIKEWGRH